MEIDKVYFYLQDDYSIGAYHAFEHLLCTSIDQVINSELFEQFGIIYEAETFIGGIVLTFYLSVDSKNLVIEDVVEKATNNVKNLQRSAIDNELRIIKSENHLDELNDELWVLYESLFSVFDRNVDELALNPNSSEVGNLLKLVPSRFTKIRDGSATCSIMATNINSQKHKMQIVSRNGFDAISIPLTIVNTKDLVEMYFLNFVIGIKIHNFIEKIYLKPRQQYLGYSQILLVGNQIVFQILVQNEKQEKNDWGKLFNKDAMFEFLSENFKKNKACFKTYLQAYVTRTQILEQAAFLSTIADYSKILSLVNDLTLESVCVTAVNEISTRLGRRDDD
ncbi:hypothetical protein [Lactiplantibacillus plantarum]|uniref:hypothetical protein n=1 Tax=Lactiplantibacillus plantarum TaxID=1590 RepID=UPI000B3EABBE|nr:hypothetical protein [Lactiplantibacillus plantarum]ARW14477.1 hypothetical protein S100434_02359 [Lactiplantibacillus plantarum subsp. plantarum]MDO7794598.1 hypothetical protein [Lactiplantibacillus plantarum]MYU99509.1 hypothetical protein [Lactiplantibacillus plantarum]QHM22459.1 hypothetical protein C7M31_01943 [Lactiplantibacillus plantarum]QHM24602.1 hypothetical protein C7M32_01112 [Lactiplantibacillus plantarum]